MIRKITNFTFVFFLVALLISFVGREQAAFVEKYVAMPLRSLLAGLSGRFTVPIFELLLVSSPLLLLLPVFFRRGTRVLTLTLSFLFAAYCITLAIPDKAYSAEQSAVLTDEDMQRAAEVIADRLAEIGEPGATEEVEPSVTRAVSQYAESLGIATRLPPVKQSVIPTLLDRMGILAFYAFPTAEIIVNAAQPDFMRVFSAAHELMHYIGITNEDVADFSAFLALRGSGDAALEYSAYVTAFAYVGGALYANSPTAYEEILDMLSARVRQSLHERGEFLAQRAGNDASTALNNVVLSLRDPRGSDSYSNSVALIASAVLSEK